MEQPDGEVLPPATTSPDDALVAVIPQVMAELSNIAKHEFETRRVESDNNAKVALATLEAQRQATIALAENNTTALTRRYGFIIIVTMILVAAAIALVYEGQATMVIEVLEKVTAFTSVGFGGYQLGKSKGRQSTSE